MSKKAVAANPVREVERLSIKGGGHEGITAHGVRKWRATKMAENGGTEYQLMAWFGWRDPKEARPYIVAASRKRLAQEAAAKMAGV